MSSPLVEKHTAFSPLGGAESLSEEKLSVLKDLADSLGVSLGELLKTLTILIPAFGGPDMDEPLDFTDQQADIKAGQCPAEGTAVEDTTDLQKPLGEGEIENPDSVEGPQTPAEAAEYENYLGMNCYQIKALYEGKLSLLKNGQAGNASMINRSLDLLESAAKENGCHL